MAESRLVLCDALCFLVNRFGKTPMRQLKAMLTDFYPVEVVYEAKVRLFDDIKGLNLESKLPHIPLRRVGEGRLANEVDDLLSMFTYLDEAKARAVARNLF